MFDFLRYLAKREGASIVWACATSVIAKRTRANAKREKDLNVDGRMIR